MTAAAAFAGRVDDATLRQIGDHIAEVEAELRVLVGSRVALVETIGAHTLQAGGKRLRPAFVWLSAKSIGRPFDPARARRLGACMEMIHMATLIHDDVIDDAATRRGQPTASAVHGSTAAILSGDVLLSRAMSVLADDGDLDVIRRVSRAVVDLAEGEVRELEIRGRVDLSYEEHAEILRMKTASFIECCCRVGARIAGANEAEEVALGTFGHHVGMAFQLVDDLLDYRGDHAKTGKPAATDYHEGCATLPLIALWPHLGEDERARISAGFGQSDAIAYVPEIIALMEARGAFREAEQAAADAITQAKHALAILPNTSARELLAAAADFVVARQS
jgi:octaprenyl-diphosphate synthase